jgi:hypothetical protein
MYSSEDTSNHKGAMIDDREIHIHGEINNPKHPIIFGFGDEDTPEYKEIKRLGDSSLLEYSKHIYYDVTNDRNSLIRFTESGPYQVYLMGHSCGMADRVLLRQILDNDNCKSIKPFYYAADDNGFTSYKNISQNLHLIFDDEAKLREKLVTLGNCEAMPQWNDPKYKTELPPQQKNNK